MASKQLVKAPAGQYFSSFEEACDEYLGRLLPEWKTSDRTHMFPPAFPFRYTAPTGAASGAVRLSKSEEVDVKGDIAELQIFRSLDKFGRETNQPMFVLTKFEFKEFTEEVLRQKLPSEYVDSLFAELSEKDLSREIDFLVVHRRIGVILIEVKATEKFKPNRYLDAKKQLQVGEQFVQALLQAKGINIPIYKVVAMPNVNDVGRDATDFIDLRKIHLSLSDDDDENPSHFELWWKKHFTERSFATEEEEFPKFISILVGQRTAISATAHILSGVFKTIDEQSFLQRSYLKMIKKGACSSEVVIKPTDKAGLSILAKQFMFLNVEQLGIWEGSRHQVFCGAPGSGKTILLQYKALECVKKNEMVLLLVPPPLDKLYKEFFARNEITNAALIHVVTFDSLPDFLEAAPRNPPFTPFHIFVDEFQIILTINQELLNAFKGFLGRHQNADYYQWIAYDINQMLLVNEAFGMKRSRVNSPGFLAELCQDQNFVHAPSLTTVMRCTSEVYDFLQRYLQFSFGKTSSEGPEISQKYWHHPIHLGHHVCGPQVIVEGKITYTSLEERFADCSKIIKNEINEWAKEGDEFFYHKVAILVSGPRWIDELSPSMTQDGIPVCRIGDFQNAVVLDNADYSRSYEWPVVIAVCGHLKDMHNYIPSSRAVTRLLVLWWK